MIRISENKSITAAIVSYNSADLTKKACESLLENTKRRDLKLYVFDNGSSDSTEEALKDKNLNFIEINKNIGFGAAHNKILNYEMSDYHFIINPDIEIKSDVLSDIADFMDENPDIVLLMPKILNFDGTVQFLPKRKPTARYLFLGRLGRIFKSCEKIRDEYTRKNDDLSTLSDIDFCSGCFMCIRSDVFKSLKGFDERFFMYLEDADLTLRAQSFGRTVIAPQFEVTHIWDRSSAKKLKYFLIHLSSAFKFLFKRK